MNSRTGMPQQIANTAGRMYDKFVNFVKDLEEIGVRIDATGKAWEKAHNKLTSGTGNLVSRTQAMRELGAKVSKSMPAHLLLMDEEVTEPQDES